jgi:hypothetical protein
LAHLKDLTHLQQLDVGNTKVSDKGVADLRKALPKLSVLR